MGRIKDLSGQRFGRLLVQEDYETRKRRRIYWLCLCDCGTEKWVSRDSLQNGTQSCGCISIEQKSLAPGQASRNKLYQRYKNDAKRRGYEFSLSFKNFISLCEQDCHYCGNMPMNVAKISSNGDFVYNGIDRVNSDLSYFEENCVSCCSRCNLAKGTMGKEEFLLLVERIYRHRRVCKGNSEHKKYAAFIGRWQPMHKGHMWLIKKKLDQGIPCVIFVRDIPPDEKNPFTTEETISMIEAAFTGEAVIVQAISDVESINWGRGVGYETNEFKPPEDIKRISATDIRNRIKTGDDSWRDFVNSYVADWLETYYAE
jgi:nicotinamide mononucleotide adenylyltransferase